jgi:PAN domain-containing protein
MFRFGVIKSVLAAVIAVAIFSGPSAAADKKPFFEKNIDRWGADFSVFKVKNGGANTCYQACAKDKTCLAWTFHRPGTKGKVGECHLKSKVAHPSPNPCCISGVLVGQSAIDGYGPVAASGDFSKPAKARKAYRSKAAKVSRRMFKSAGLSEGEAIGLPEFRVAALAPPMKITPVSFTASEEF